jgi:hypothetical protein
LDTEFDIEINVITNIDHELGIVRISKRLKDYDKLTCKNVIISNMREVAPV